MRSLAWLFMLFLFLALGACSPGMIVLRQPETGQLAECRATVPEALHVIPDTEPCAEGYEKQGYARLVP